MPQKGRDQLHPMAQQNPQLPPLDTPILEDLLKYVNFCH